MVDCVDVIDRRWFKFVVIVLGIAIAIMAGFSIAAFWTARQGQPINPTTANGLWIANIILLILAVGIVLWGLITLFIHRTVREAVTDRVTEVAQDTGAGLRNYLTESDIGFAAPGQYQAVAPQPYTVAQEVTSFSGAGNRITGGGYQRIQAGINNY